MRRLSFSPEAKSDLLEIADYIARDDPARAATFVEELEERCAGLVNFPESGTARPELAPELRSKPHGRYIIFYRASPAELRIARILHGARDIGGEF